ncbi:MAG: hypothetical protein WEB19_02560 [Acidimicrobiia bacterium]
MGSVTITSVVEDEVEHIPPELFFRESNAAAVARHDWLVPDYVDEHGNVTLRVQAFVVETGGRTRRRRRLLVHAHVRGLAYVRPPAKRGEGTRLATG